MGYDMNDRYRLFQNFARGGGFYLQDNVTLKQESLRTKDRATAERLLAARNKAARQPAINRAIAEELAGTGVTVTALCPGPTATNFAEAASARTSRLFKKTAMSAQKVARGGHRAFRQGRVVAIPGLSNALLAFSVRLAPRVLVRKVTKRLNAGRHV
jgi:hypothetical protein